jgi:hypothetical protein
MFSQTEKTLFHHEVSMSSRSPTEYENTAPLHAPRFVMPAQAGIQATEGGWIPAFAGMTEALCQFVIQVALAHVFSKKDTKSTQLGALVIRTLRVLCAFVVNFLSGKSIWTT